MIKKILICACLLMLAVSGCGRAGSYFEQSTEDVLKEDAAEADTQIQMDQAGEDCYVYVCGAVAHPGVYRLPAQSRIYEAVEMAGGLLQTACSDSVNLAEEVEDGLMVKILTQDEAVNTQGTDSAGGTQDGRVNLNTADAGELMQLPGIGASKADSILSYRKEKGAFASIEEIKNITGIKEGVYSKIKDYITVN